MKLTEAIWHGTGSEAEALMEALAHNCSCEHDAQGQRIRVCAGHAALVHDQRFMDGLVYARRIAR